MGHRVEQKPQIQALESIQPLVPMGLGYVVGVTHGCIRLGTTTLLAAVEVVTRDVITQSRGR